MSLAHCCLNDEDVNVNRIHYIKFVSIDRHIVAYRQKLCCKTGLNKILREFWDHG